MRHLILFDLDGTLTDPKEGITRCVDYALQSFGIKTKKLDDLCCFIGPPLKEQFMEYCGFTETEAERAVEKYRERYRGTGIFENRIYPGIPALLKGLKEKGDTVALATSKPTVFAKRILEEYRIAPYFDCAVGSELDGTRTEKAQVVAAVLKKLAVSKEELSQTYLVGDRMHDVIGARSCGIVSVGVRYGYAAPGELEQAGADHILDTVEELCAFLLPPR